MRDRLLALLLLSLGGCSSGQSNPTFEVYGDGLPGRADLAAEVPAGVETGGADQSARIEPTSCKEDGDCESGLCLTSLMKPACALPCDDGVCEVTGWKCFVIKGDPPDGSKQLCLPALSLLCLPCQQDSDCRPVGGGGKERCLMLGGAGTFCTVPCVQHADCPLGYKCIPFAQDDGKLSGQCQPKIDQCVCGEVGKKVTWSSDCAFVNEWGACLGSSTCPKSGSANCSAKVPAEDVCNGLDDDCDGDTDDGGLIGKACGKSNKGVCKMGIVVCGEDLQEQCDGNVDPTTEICDNLDNNCDGQTDEEFPEDNGPCGADIGICKQGKTWCNKGMLACKGDVKPAVETCNALDDDCDGSTDEELPGTGDVCGKTLGECKEGKKQCAGGKWICAGEVAPATESCDLKDNDCDGATDEELPGAGDKCGTDTGVCKSGTKKCQGGNWICEGEVGGSGEVCDGKDNNCNGPVDEGLGSTSCGKGVCAHTVDNCKNGALQTCNPYEGASAEICDGLDNDCDGTVDPDCEDGGGQ